MYKIIVKENDKYVILELGDNMVYANEHYFDSRKSKLQAEQVLSRLQLKQDLEEYDKKSFLGKLFSFKPEAK